MRTEIEAILNRSKDFQPAPGQTFKRFDSSAQSQRSQSVFRGFDPHAHQFRNCGETAGSGHHFYYGGRLQRLKGRIAGGHAEHARRYAAGCDRHAACGFGSAPFSVTISSHPDRERGRRHARASHAGAAGRAYDLGSAGTLEGLRVAIIGDIAHSRVARSNIFLLSKFGVQVVSAGRHPCCRERWGNCARNGADQRHGDGDSRRRT